MAKERKITFIYFNFLLEAAAAVGAVNISRWQIFFNDFGKGEQDLEREES